VTSGGFVAANVPEVEPLAEQYARMAHTFERRPVDLVLRACDIVLASAALVFLSPVMLVVALAVLASGGRPILYSGLRVGQAGHSFTMRKFRTLAPDAERRLGPYLGAELTHMTSSEVTAVGRVLRATKLDELPQLYNVLRGDMSIVGPRPERPEFVRILEEAVPFWNRRLLIKPGVTGWAQVRCGYAADCESTAEKLAYDLWYLRHRNLVIDLAVCVKTARMLLSDSRAH
jgi:lipopolysaccharide/colanic/teichoic acid biosynthesis glycosyltransferase